MIASLDRCQRVRAIISVPLTGLFLVTGCSSSTTNNSGNCDAQGKGNPVTCVQLQKPPTTPPPPSRVASPSPSVISHRHTQPSGVPQTGPAAEITVTSADAKSCGSTAQYGFRSPATTVFSDVSLAAPQITASGRAASVMQGFYDGQEYYWIESYPNGYSATMWLRWYLNPASSHYCIVAIPDGPPSALPKAVASMAIPVVVDGGPVTFVASILVSSPLSFDTTGTLEPPQG